jgi:FtsP/CotA-like multicopper oxidase with cupredoxin domain
MEETMRHRTERLGRRALILAAVAAVAAAAWTVGSRAGAPVRAKEHPAAASKRQAPVWVVGDRRASVRAVHPAAARRATAAPVATPSMAPPRTTPAHASRKPAAAPPPVELCAKAGTADPGSGPIPIWGFALRNNALSCNDATVVARIPGPQLDIPAGASVTVNVTNAVPGHTLRFEAAGLTVSGTVDIAPGTTATLTLSGPEGTYLYDSGGDAGRQQAMGLYGALVVHAPTPNTADGVQFDREQVLVLSEIDPAFSAAPDTFDMNAWHPTIWLINGRTYPGTATLDVRPGQRLLLRWANAGADHDTMSVLGLHQRLLARGGFPLTAPYDVVSQTFPAGDTADALLTIPDAAAPGTRFPIYNRNLNMGMTMFLRVPA